MAHRIIPSDCFIRVLYSGCSIRITDCSIRVYLDVSSGIVQIAADPALIFFSCLKVTAR